MCPAEQDPSDAALPPAPTVGDAQRARVRARLFGQLKETASLIAGKYRRIALLGEGGNGSVWEVEHVHTAGRFALKLLPHIAPGASANKRFLDARAASRVGHEHIVQVTDAGETEAGTAYVVMELIRGQTLAEVLEEGGPMPWLRARAILEQIADALGCAHAASIVHRDLKAENVMLTSRRAGADFCKIVDFGVAKILDSDSTQRSHPGARIGTPSTMSPEQIRGEPVDPRADVYALGCLAFQLVTGRRPFAGPVEGVLAQHLTSPPPSVGASGGAPEVAARIDGFIARAMAKERGDRFADMREVLVALAAIDPRGTPAPAAAEAHGTRSVVPSIAGIGAVALVATGAWWSWSRETPAVETPSTERSTRSAAIVAPTPTQAGMTNAVPASSPAAPPATAPEATAEAADLHPQLVSSVSSTRPGKARRSKRGPRLTKPTAAPDRPGPATKPDFPTPTRQITDENVLTERLPDLDRHRTPGP